MRQCQVFDAGQYVSGMDWCPMSEADSASMLLPNKSSSADPSQNTDSGSSWLSLL